MTLDISAQPKIARHRSMRSRVVAVAGLSLFVGLAFMAQNAQAQFLPPPDPGSGRYGVITHTPDEAARLLPPAGSISVPSWKRNVVSPLNGVKYVEQMVGHSPFTTTTTVKVQYIPIVVRYHFPGGVTLDPTLPSCGDTVPIQTRFFNSPIFSPVAITSNGIDVSAGSGGSTLQLINAFQRASFWSHANGTKYGVSLVLPKGQQVIVVDLNAPGGSGVAKVSASCGNVYLGEIDLNAFDAQMQAVIAAHATPKQLPIVLTYNVVQTDGGCCILGYHNAIAVLGGTQTYSTGAYVNSGIFTGVNDISVWSHETAEWMDDPFVQASVQQAGFGFNDITPAWGHVGQVGGCQNNLEVGDPLTGTSFSVVGAAGFTYHFQDLAFGDWFFRTASNGTGGKYSFQGTFTSSQGVCH